MKFRQSPSNARKLERIISVLCACPVGQTISYEEISRASGQHLTCHSHLLRDGLKKANEQTGAAFRNVRLVGYERLEAVEVPAAFGKSSRERARRSHRRASAVISNTTAKSNSMSNKDKLKAFAEMTHLGLLEHLSKDRAAPKLPEGTLPTDPGHAVRRTLDAMRLALGRAV